MKQCPYCAEQIQDDATVCQFCGHPLVKKPWPVFGPALLFGAGMGMLDFVYRLMRSANLNEAMGGGISSVLIYGLIYSLVVWVKRFWFQKTAKKAVSAESGCYSVLIFLAGMMLFACGIAWIYLRPAVQSLVSVPGLPEPTETRGPRPTDTKWPTPVTDRTFPAPYSFMADQLASEVSLGPYPGSRQLATSDDPGPYEADMAMHARNLAIPGGYEWEIYLLPLGTRFQNVEEFYTSRLRLSGYDMTFMDQGMNEVYLIKYKHGLNRIAIQFNGGSSPSLLLFRWVG